MSDERREFKAPDEPTDVKRVEVIGDPDSWWQYNSENGRWYFHAEDVDELWMGQTWDELITEYIGEGLIEAKKTPVEKAVEFFSPEGEIPQLPSRPTKAAIEAANVLIQHAVESKAV